MKRKHYIEVFSPGPIAPDAALAWLDTFVSPGCEVVFLNICDEVVARRATELGIRSVPAIAVDGEITRSWMAGAHEESGSQNL